MQIIKSTLEFNKLQAMAVNTFGNMVKAVIDINRELLAVEAELHSDLEALLLENGSKQNSLWGINIYPDMQGDEFIEFDSVINMRPSQGNISRGVEDAEVRKKIIEIITKKIKR